MLCFCRISLTSLVCQVAGVIVENTFTSIADMVVLFARQFGLRRGEAFLRGFLYFFLTKYASAVLCVVS